MVVVFTMALHRSFCLFVVTTLYGVCQAQCVFRTLMPMTMVDTCTACGFNIDEPQSLSCSTDDLCALLMLFKALEMDKASSANNGIDVNGLLNTLVHALVYTATHNGGRCYDCNHNRYPTKGPPTGSGNIPTTGPNHDKKDENDPLINLNLLNDKLAELDVLGANVLDVDIGDNKG